MINGLDAMKVQIAAMNAQLIAALPDIVMEAAAMAEQEIARRAPVDTGALARNLDEVGTRSRTGAAAVVQVEQSAKGGAEHYAVFNEYGTSRQPAKPFFRPGFAAAEPKMQQFITSAIEDIIKKAQ